MTGSIWRTASSNDETDAVAVSGDMIYLHSEMQPSFRIAFVTGCGKTLDRLKQMPQTGLYRHSCESRNPFASAA